MKNFNTRVICCALIASLVVPFVLLGCGTKDVDPQAKVDAPGYYNGPLDAKAKANSDKGK